MVDEQAFRDLMAGVCAPVTIVTTSADGPHGTTVSAFASLSLRPPMVTVALDRSSGLLARILRTGRFGVNILGSGQAETALAFARRGDRFASVAWYTDQGLPRLAEAPGFLACDLARPVDGGDHLLLLGTVRAVRSRTAAPLVYGNRIFGTHSGFADRPRRPIDDLISACSR
ncbi:4-nitrophenol 4-monooxygenase/4-nitrocatechol 2-monooxygenase, reductase component [Actinomadura rubteroloni]|uniref:4-nitrophenol 4-monooxygenase/4-nitrocatechol 2-monooxygenase, reductase component n=1 Tax=Actinomadura rubteroloni TaxID=1926885 RepID=A0A2P4UDT3_9ACTN|nr:flavin reductase family protein [Actinomadura rubteroloni]POM23191.1 4-nitrophenol 4-monooxygenase/4-nitrocatechol 2-monooxygenase, reductase component [Actinomadura rubteroloni]